MAGFTPCPSRRALRHSSGQAARAPLPLAARAGGAGFTLIEVLLAITLLGIIMVLAYQGLRTGASSAERGEAAIERVNRLRLAQEFVRSQISRAQPMAFEHDDTLGGVVFEGGPEALRFAGPMPGYLSFGGSYVQTLALVDGDSGLDLVFDHEVLRYGPDADADAPREQERDPVLLIGGLRDARFSYLEPAEDMDDEPEWVDEWRDTGTLPLLVRLEAGFEPDARLRWPVLTVAPMVDGGGLITGEMEFGPAPGSPSTRRERR